MRKIFIICFLLVIGLLAFPKIVHAACDYVRDGNNICINHFVDCLLVTGSGACCDTADECPSPPTPTPTQPPPPPPPPSGCDDPQAIRTAIGCINVSGPTGFVSSVLKLAIGIGGGIAFLLIIFGAFQILTSSGNPEKIQAGKELITSAIAGLLLIIFSIFLLRLIGKDILGILTP